MNKTLKALELFEKDLEKLIDKVNLKIEKEKENFENKVKELEDYKFKESNIIQIWGYGGISTQKKNNLINLLENYKKIRNEETVLGKYKTILLNDLKQIRREIQIEKSEKFA